MESDQQQIDEAEAFFLDRNFRMVIEERDESANLRDLGAHGTATEGWTHWADLHRIDNPDAVVLRYGSGRSRAEAARRAVRRWRTEQGD